MTRIRIDFCDFWPGFSKTKNFFVEVLSSRFEVEITDRPDFLIYADFGRRHLNYTCPRIFFSGESTAPDFRQCDYAFTSHYVDDPRHMRLPLYALYTKPDALIKAPDEHEELLRAPRNFCSFVVSNPKNRARTAFFQHLSGHKRVDSGGRHLNNIGGAVEDKASFLRSYKFNIAFENCDQPGYTTEKIVEAMIARCIPIYWGNTLIARDFNPKSFLHYPEFASEDALIERILEIDRNEDVYLQYLREPYFRDNRPNEFFDRERLLNQFEHIFSERIEPVGAHRRSWFQLGRWIPINRLRRH